MSARNPPPHPNPALRQRGSVLVPAAFAILLGLILLWGAQLGYAMYLKRELQKTADLAALTGAQVLDRGLDLSTSCAAAASAAAAAATSNMPAAKLDTQPTCWSWSASSGASVLAAATDSPNTGNAVQVRLSADVPALFPYAGGVSSVHALATAVRNGEPTATFSIGTELVGTPESPQPGSLVDLLAGVGLDLSGTSLVGYDGLANVQITPAGLLQSLGISVPANVSIGQLETLLDTQVSLSDLLNAAISTANISDAQKSDLLAANVTLLNAIAAKVGVSNLLVQLGSAGNGGLFALIDTTDPSSVLNANVNLLNLIATSASIASGGHALSTSTPVSVPPISIPGIVNISGVSATAQTGIIEGPSIGTGGVGTTAYTAQVRAAVNVSSNISLLGNLVKVGLNLPIIIEGVNGKATLEKLCETRDSVGPQAHIAVDSSVLKICVGQTSNPPAGWPFSTTEPCDTGLTDTKLLSVTLAGVNLATLNTHLVIPALPATGEGDFHKGQIESFGNQLLVGTTVKNLTDSLLAALLGKGTQTSGISAAQIAQGAWNDTANLCTANTASCHTQRMTAATNRLSQDASGLQGFVGGLTSDVLGVADSLVTLNVGGLLTGVGNLVGGLVNGLNGLLNGLLGGLLGGGDPCWTLLGGSQESTCVGTLASQINSSSSSGATVALLGALTTVLQPLLDSIGSQVLTPVINNLLGLNAGLSVVQLMDIDCTGKGVQLVQ